jgi:protein-disulfide isomerase
MSRPRTVWLVPGLVLLVAAALIGSTVFSGNGEPVHRAGTAATSTEAPRSTHPDESTSGAVSPETIPGDMARRVPHDPLALGPVDAPVVLVVYADYQCPYCALWSKNTLPRMRHYARTGSLRIEWRQLNIFGPASTRASKAAYAAGLQGKFWAYHDALYPEGKHRPASELSTSALTRLAVSLGLDRARFTADYDSTKVQRAVARDEDEGTRLGVMATPSFLLNGKPIVGAQPTSHFVKLIDADLAHR